MSSHPGWQAHTMCIPRPPELNQERQFPPFVTEQGRSSTATCAQSRRSVLEQSLQPDPLDERRSGQSGYLTLPGEHGRMILHGLRGEGGSVEPEISPLTVSVATRSRMEVFRLPFGRDGRAGHPAWFSWAG